MIVAKECIACHQCKPLTDFSRRSQSADQLQAKCRACVADYQRWRRQEKQQTVYAYLLTHPCVDCGEPDPVVLEFDHIKGEKSANVKVLVGSGHWGMSKVLAEIAKCEVRCANCHRRVTAQRDGRHAWILNPVPEPNIRRYHDQVCGTRASYQRGCRCADCRKAQLDYQNEWNKRQRASVA